MAAGPLAEVVTSSSSFRQQESPGELVTDFQCHAFSSYNQAGVWHPSSVVLLCGSQITTTGLLLASPNARKRRQLLSSSLTLANPRGTHTQQNEATFTAVRSRASESNVTSFEEITITTSDSHSGAWSPMFGKANCAPGIHAPVPVDPVAPILAT